MLFVVASMEINERRYFQSDLPMSLLDFWRSLYKPVDLFKCVEGTDTGLSHVSFSSI